MDHLVAERSRQREHDPVADDRAVATSRLDGSGSLYVEFGSAHLPLVAQAIDDRADAWHPLASAPDLPDPGETCDGALTATHRPAVRVDGRNAGRRAAALFELVTRSDAATFGPIRPDDGTSPSGRRFPTVPPAPNRADRKQDVATPTTRGSLTPTSARTRTLATPTSRKSPSPAGGLRWRGRAAVWPRDRVPVPQQPPFHRRRPREYAGRWCRGIRALRPRRTGAGRR